MLCANSCSKTKNKAFLRTSTLRQSIWIRFLLLWYSTMTKCSLRRKGLLQLIACSPSSRGSWDRNSRWNGSQNRGHGEMLVTHGLLLAFYHKWRSSHITSPSPFKELCLKRFCCTLVRAMQFQTPLCLGLLWYTLFATSMIHLYKIWKANMQISSWFLNKERGVTYSPSQTSEF